MKLCQIAGELVDNIRAEAIGWAYADACISLDNGNDPRHNEMPEVLERALQDLNK